MDAQDDCGRPGGATEFASDGQSLPASANFYPLERFLAFFSARFSLSDFCAVFLPSFFGLSCPFMYVSGTPW